jgi:hypothetical protein
MHSLLLAEENLQIRIKPLSNDSVRRIRRQNTHTAGGAGLEPSAREHVVPTYLPLDRLPRFSSKKAWKINFKINYDNGSPLRRYKCLRESVIVI